MTELSSGFNASDWPVPRVEREHQEHATDDLEALSLADAASELLSRLVEQITIDATHDTPDASALRRHALWFMAIITFRALRAATQVMAAGYEDQAVGFHRLIDEVHNRAQEVRNDPTGKIARDWLAGRNLSKGAKLAGREFWDFLSGPVHANSRAVLDWLAISQCDGVTRVRLGPERRPDMANAALTVMAAEGRDIANLLAIECDISVDLRGLDAALALATARYIPEDEQLDE